MFPLTNITKTRIKSMFYFWSFWKQKSLISETVDFYKILARLPRKKDFMGLFS